MYTYKHTHTYTYIHTCLHAYTVHTYMYKRTFTHTYVRTYIFCTHIRICTNVRTFTHTYIYHTQPLITVHTSGWSLSWCCSTIEEIIANNPVFDISKRPFFSRDEAFSDGIKRSIGFLKMIKEKHGVTGFESLEVKYLLRYVRMWASDL